MLVPGQICLINLEPFSSCSDEQKQGLRAGVSANATTEKKGGEKLEKKKMAYLERAVCTFTQLQAPHYPISPFLLLCQHPHPPPQLRQSV